MNNLEIANEALTRGEQWYQSAIRAFEDQRWNDVVYSYQMAVEQALKAILILNGIEYPCQCKSVKLNHSIHKFLRDGEKLLECIRSKVSDNGTVLENQDYKSLIT